MNTISHRVYQTGEGERESDQPRTSENQAMSATTSTCIFNNTSRRSKAATYMCTYISNIKFFINKCYIKTFSSKKILLEIMAL